MFGLCEGMKWNHLPVFGGIYDQDPQLLERWRYIFAVRTEYEEEQRRKEQQRSRRGRSR